MSIRCSYDRLIDDKGAGSIEARDYTCTVDKQGDQVTTLAMNGHQQAFRLKDEEWSIMRKSGSGRR